MKRLLIMTAVIEVGAGVALLCCPSATVVLLIGAPLEVPVALTLARAGGAGLVALGVACWLVRGDPQSGAARGLISAMLPCDIVAIATLTVAGIGFGLQGVALWPTVVLRTVMIVWCIACLAAQSPERDDGQ